MWHLKREKEAPYFLNMTESFSKFCIKFATIFCYLFDVALQSQCPAAIGREKDLQLRVFPAADPLIATELPGGAVLGMALVLHQSIVAAGRRAAWIGVRAATLAHVGVLLVHRRHVLGRSDGLIALLENTGKKFQFFLNNINKPSIDWFICRKSQEKR